MQKTHLILPALALAGLAACADAPTPLAPVGTTQASFDASAAGGTWLVDFNKGVPAGFADRVAALGGQVVFAHNEAGVGAVSGLDAAAAASLGQLSGVRAVVMDDETLLDPGMEVDAEDAGLDSPANPTTAFFYPRQWHHRAIGANTAWAAGRRGSASVDVGILDTGINYTYPDLVGRVDLARSRSFVASEDARVIATWGAATHPIADLHYHGTHVASTVASNSNTVAGVTSGTTLVGVKVCHAGNAPSWTGSCPTSSVLAGITYAADIELDVINMSLGGAFLRRGVSAQGGDGPSFFGIINKVFNYAHRKGVTVVVSAGNSNYDMSTQFANAYFSYCDAPHVICVSATGPTSGGTLGPWANVDNKASYSNYGGSVTLAAPGGAGGGLVWQACSRHTIVTSVLVCRTGTFTVGLTGTSMATPHVAGAAALVVEDVGRDPAQVRARLKQTADDLGAPDWDPIYGHGRLNVARAVGL
jgi:subtilisin family serine protease